MMFSCFNKCFNKVQHEVIPLVNEQQVCLDVKKMGRDTVLIKGGTRICGSGGALATAPLVQSKSYFEVKIQQDGQWSIGLATSKANLNLYEGGHDMESWCLCSDNNVYHNSITLDKIANQTFEEITELPQRKPLDVNKKIARIPQEGDTIGISFDHIQINFYVNGANLHIPVFGVKGLVYPALYVGDGAILDVIFENFKYQPPPGFDQIMFEQSLL